MLNTMRGEIKEVEQTMSSSPVSVLIVTLELDRVNRSACGCNPNLSPTVHPTGDCRTTSVRSLRSPALPAIIAPYRSTNDISCADHLAAA